MTAGSGIAAMAALQTAEKKPTQAEVLIQLAQDAELFHTSDGLAVASFTINGHRENAFIKRQGFREWLVSRYYAQEGKPPSAQALQDTLGALEAMAKYSGARRDLFVRVAGIGEKIYLDLGNDAWEAVEVDGNGWRIVAEPPVRFLRPRGLQKIPCPEAGYTVDDLRALLNLPDDKAFVLTVAWLVAALRPTGPYPILSLQGEQGSAKSCQAELLRNLIDPCSVPLRSMPREERDLMISATNAWILNFDNLSGLQHWLSDALCRLATGGGFSTRALFTDQDEILFDAQRPIILNGIDEIATRPDLLDRALVLHLPSISEEKRKTKADVLLSFESVRARVLGALLDGVSSALRNLHKVDLPGLPRLADFAVWVVAAEEGLGWERGTFMKAFTSSRAEAMETALEGDEVATALRGFMEDRIEWHGSMSELLNHLTENVDERQKRHWPSTARKLSNHLRRAATLLRASGVEVERGEKLPHRHQKEVVVRKRRDSMGATGTTGTGKAETHGQ